MSSVKTIEGQNADARGNQSEQTLT